MQVVEHEPHRVIADRMHFEERNALLAGNGLALVWRMALHLGARTLHAQVFGAEVERFAALEDDCQCLAILVQPQLGRPGVWEIIAHLCIPACV